MNRDGLFFIIPTYKMSRKERKSTIQTEPVVVSRNICELAGILI